jgi:hypothetical protein
MFSFLATLLVALGCVDATPASASSDGCEKLTHRTLKDTTIHIRIRGSRRRSCAGVL